MASFDISNPADREGLREAIDTAVEDAHDHLSGREMSRLRIRYDVGGRQYEFQHMDALDSFLDNWSHYKIADYVSGGGDIRFSIGLVSFDRRGEHYDEIESWE